MGSIGHILYMRTLIVFILLFFVFIYLSGTDIEAKRQKLSRDEDRRQVQPTSALPLTAPTPTIWLSPTIVPINPNYITETPTPPYSPTPRKSKTPTPTTKPVSHKTATNEFIIGGALLGILAYIAHRVSS